MSNAFAAKRMALMQYPGCARSPHQFNAAQGFANAMERTLDLLERMEHLMVQDTDPTSLDVKREIHEFKQRQYVAPGQRK